MDKTKKNKAFHEFVHLVKANPHQYYAIKNGLHHIKEMGVEMNSKGYGWINGRYIKPSKEYEMRQTKLRCIDMINSILAYGCYGYTAEEVTRHEENKYHNYLKDYVDNLGRDVVVKLIQEQINSIQSIKTDVHTDSEGVTYNSIIWKQND